MLTNEVPEQSAARVPEPRRQGHRLIAVVLAVGLAAFCAATARLFMFPAWGMPARVDAIVMLADQGDRCSACATCFPGRRAAPPAGAPVRRPRRHARLHRVKLLTEALSESGIHRIGPLPVPHISAGMSWLSSP
jgi:hypothetical protein